MPRAVGNATPEANPHLAPRSHAPAKGLPDRGTILRMDGIENSALVQGISEQLADRPGDQRSTASTRREQSPPNVELEDQIRRLRAERTAAGLEIAQPGGLLGDLLPEPAELVDEFGPCFRLVAAQRATSRWSASRSAPHLTCLRFRYKPPRRPRTRGIFDPRSFSAADPRAIERETPRAHPRRTGGRSSRHRSNRGNRAVIQTVLLNKEKFLIKFDYSIRNIKEEKVLSIDFWSWIRGRNWRPIAFRTALGRASAPLPRGRSPRARVAAAPGGGSPIRRSLGGDGRISVSMKGGVGIAARSPRGNNRLLAGARCVG